MMKDPDQVQSQFIQFDLNQLEKLKNAANVHIKFSKIYLPMLRNMSQPYDSEKNPDPWKTLKEGSYYLGNAYHLVQKYKDCAPGSILNKHIRSVNDILVKLEFDPEHKTRGYTNEAYGGKVECFVSKGQGTKYYNLLHSDLKKDVRSFLEIVERNIELPVVKFLESIEQRLQAGFSKKLLEASENRSVVVNLKDSYGRTPLHHAVYKGDIDVVSTLLKNGANVAQITNKGNTPLHLASSKGCKEVVELLLRRVSSNELNDFIDTRTTSGGTTALHVAAEKGFLEVVKSLLRHGATYSIENKDGKIPCDLSKDQEIVSFLQLVQEVFEDTKTGNVEIVNKLRKAKQDEFLAVMNARNNQGKTVSQVALINNHTNIARILFKMFPKCELDKLEKLKSAAKVHIDASGDHLRFLQHYSQPYKSEKNRSPHETLEKGSYYLRKAYDLVQEYENCKPVSIENESMQSVNALLVELEFDPEHITYTNEAYGRKFVSKGQGTKYYNLLHSDLKKDVRSFLEMVERNIELLVKKFLESIEQRLQPAFSEKLLEAIKNGDPLAVENCIKRSVVVNFKDSHGGTPLYHAVYKGNIEVVRALLKYGANVAQITNKGNTPLHLASSKGCKEVVELLLRRVSSNELNDFIDTRTTSGGTTALHVAAEKGFLEVVKSLLRHGATYNIENKDGKIPCDLSKDQEIVSFLKLVENLFKDTKTGNVKIINKSRIVKQDEVLAVMNARNNQGITLYEIALINNHTNMAKTLLTMFPKFELDHLEKLKSVAKWHIESSNCYLPMLRSMSQPYDSEKNPLPWKTLKEGSYYLGDVYRLVQAYKNCKLVSIDNESIQNIHAMLVELEFDPEHITSGYTDEAYCGMSNCFVSKGQGTKYYNLLHSDLKKDVRSFIEMVEFHIDIPVVKFLKSIESRLQSAFS